MLSESERAQVREAFPRILRQYHRHDERGAWCAEHPDDEEAEHASRKSSTRLRELISELAEWCGTTDAEMTLLVGEVVEKKAEPDEETCSPLTGGRREVGE